MDDSITEQAIAAMKQGGKDAVAHAKAQWGNNAYRATEEMMRSQLDRWNAIGERITELAKQLKADHQ